MPDAPHLLNHFLAALAYRTQKALRGAREDFAGFRAAPNVRTPHELVCHMNSVIGYAATFMLGGSYREGPLPGFQDEIDRFHGTLSRLASLVSVTTDWSRITPEQLLQGPLSDAMTHAGQLAMLRRLAGDPVPPENFVFAKIDPLNLTSRQALPARPDDDWPERP